MIYHYRAITANILEALQYQSCIFINEPRQAGKSTLALKIAKQYVHANYANLDDLNILAAATSDPENFVAKFEQPVAIDEVQLAPEIFRPLKKRIDKLRQQNNLAMKFILTGSSNVLAWPTLADALVGRMQVVTLYPISAGEYLKKTNYNLIDELFTKKFFHGRSSFVANNIGEIIANSTYPEIAFNANLNRQQWFDSYIMTLLQREIRTISAIENITALPRMLKFLATRATGLVSDAALARDTGFNAVTYKCYRTLLNLLFLLIDIEPWHRNVTKRLVKAPKLFFTDTALLCHLLNIDINGAKTASQKFLAELSNFS